MATRSIEIKIKLSAESLALMDSIKASYEDWPEDAKDRFLKLLHDRGAFTTHSAGDDGAGAKNDNQHNTA